MLRITDANRRWWVLVGACMGLFVLMLDSTVVALALPSIQRDLDAAASELQWVQNAYLLVIAALVVTAGRLGDIAGRRRVFLLGMSLFVAGSAVSALAPSPLALVAGRVVQGVGGAGLLSLSLAIVSNAFGDEERPRALGLWAAVSGVSLAIGPLVGGFLIAVVDWRWIFWINLPFGLLGLLITLRATEESRDATAGGRIDVAGLVVLSAGLVAVVFALVESLHWSTKAVVGVLAAGIVLLVLFWFVEHRVREPIVDFALFRNGPYFGASAAGFTLVGSYWVLMFYEPQYLQNMLSYSALEAGLLVLPITAPMVVLSPLVPRLERRFGTRAVMTAGMALSVAGLVVLTQVAADSGYGLLLVGFLLFGLALGLVYAAMSTAAMEAMPREKAGIASGVLAMNRVMAGALSLAVVGALFQHLEDARRAALTPSAGEDGAPPGDLDALLAGSPDAKALLAGLPKSAMDAVVQAAREAFAYALGHSLWVAVGLVAVGTALTWWFVRSPEATPSLPRTDRRHHARHRHLPF
jgi:EmrB/QacA subfamily drug resistance transporter